MDKLPNTYLMPQLLVCLIDISLCEDVQRCSHQCKQCGIEVDRTVGVERHVHSNQALEKGWIKIECFN